MAESKFLDYDGLQKYNDQAISKIKPFIAIIGANVESGKEDTISEQSPINNLNTYFYNTLQFPDNIYGLKEGDTIVFKDSENSEEGLLYNVEKDDDENLYLVAIGGGGGDVQYETTYNINPTETVGGVGPSTNIDDLKGHSFSEILDLILFKDDKPKFNQPTVSFTSGTLPQYAEQGTNINDFDPKATITQGYANSYLGNGSSSTTEKYWTTGGVATIGHNYKSTSTKLDQSIKYTITVTGITDDTSIDVYSKLGGDPLPHPDVIQPTNFGVITALYPIYYGYTESLSFVPSISTITTTNRIGLSNKTKFIIENMPSGKQVLMWVACPSGTKSTIKWTNPDDPEKDYRLFNKHANKVTLDSPEKLWENKEYEVFIMNGGVFDMSMFDTSAITLN